MGSPLLHQGRARIGAEREGGRLGPWPHLQRGQIEAGTMLGTDPGAFLPVGSPSGKAPAWWSPGDAAAPYGTTQANPPLKSQRGSLSLQA